MGPVTQPAARPMGELSTATRKEVAVWLLERLVPDSAPNNLAMAFQVEGALDVPALREALAVLYRRYDVLRTAYIATGAELLKGVVPPEGFDVALEEVDDFAPENLESGLRPFVVRQFVFDGRPLLRAQLLHHPGGDVVCLTLHHLVYDIISGTVLMEELVAIYDAVAAGRPVDPAYLTVLPAFHEPEPSAEGLEYWRGQLGDFDPAGLELSYGAPDSADPTLRGEQITHELSETARAALKRLQREVRAPEAVVLLGAFDLLLAAHGAGPDITVGSPVSIRPPDAPRTVGHHTNVLPVRAVVDPAGSFRTLVRSVRDTYFGALAHAGVTVDSISDLVPRAGSSWRNRLCRHLFNYFPQLEMGTFEIGGRRARPVVVENGYSKFDLEFFVASGARSITVSARYSTEKLTEDETRALLERYDALLALLVDEVDRPVGELLVWSGHDHAVIDAANDTGTEIGASNVAELVRRHALDTPDAVAVEHGDRRITYRRLWDAARATRALLAERSVRQGDIVAIAASRSPELVATVLGVWLAGAAYLPIDPEHPAQRVAYLLADSGAKAVFTDRELDLPGAEDKPRLPLLSVDEAPTGGAADALTDDDTPVELDRESLAYLIYTSGSSGRPKGARLPHRAIANIAADYTGRMRATPADATLWMTTFAFDMANLEHYVPLWSGGRIVIAPDEARVDGAVLRALIDRYEPRILQATPTTWRLVLDELAGRLAGRIVVTGAEPVPVTLAKRLMAEGAEVVNAYGPTETTTWCTWGVVPAGLGDRIDVGGPIGNIRMFVLAPDGRELPVGVRGEVCIAGDGVSLGYHGRPELNAERFGEHPRYGRFYRSGDTGRWLPGGVVELFGRADRQVKLRGNRIELGEVEAALRGHPEVRGAAAIVVGDRSADGRLVVFVESVGQRDIADSLWEYARTVLPRAAVPQDFVVLEAFPVNANEKVDYLALEQLAVGRHPERGAGEADSAAPVDGLTARLVDLWRELLNRDDVAPETNFFTHGGHSLLGARLVQQIEQDLGVSVKLSDFFGAPTPEALAAHIRTLQPA
jgi:amino acid adenylation domain-containing protein